jgi:hypothetical protein
MEDREAACAEAKLDLQMATNELIIHKAYLVRLKAKLDGGVVENWASDLAKLQTIIGDLEYHQNNVVALEQRARLGKSLYQTTCKDYEVLEVNISKALQIVDHVVSCQINPTTT